ncbi:MAG: molecular chaperone DnaJ [Parcubacteria group bacterium]|nr:molecular chaperone DnaJ [Parcubacteria group bacterium]
MAKDYYKILGIKKDASPEEIKRAFYQLAQKYHPDKPGGSAEKFKEVNEAYQILSNQEKRAQYDQYGESFERAQQSGGFSGFEGFGDFSSWAEAMRQGNNADFFQFDLGDVFSDFFGFGGSNAQRSRGREKGKDIVLQAEIDFMEMAHGVTKTVEYNRYTQCDECGGNGYPKGAKTDTCLACGGAGKVRKQQSILFGMFETIVACSKCGGSGKIVHDKCKVCGGDGRKRIKEKVDLKIPAGINDGDNMRYRGMGDALSASFGNEKIYGDLYVRVKVANHKKFQRDGLDIVLQKEISLSTALLGGTIEIETIHGIEKLKIPSGTKSGTVFRLKGYGIRTAHQKGDELVAVIIDIPKDLTRKQKEYIEKLKEEGL